MFELFIKADMITEEEKQASAGKWPERLFRNQMWYKLITSVGTHGKYQLDIDVLVKNYQQTINLLHEIRYGEYYDNEYHAEDRYIEELRLIKQEAEKILEEQKQIIYYHFE